MTVMINNIENTNMSYSIFYKLLHENEDLQNKLLLKINIDNNIINYNIIKSHMNQLNFNDNEISNINFLIDNNNIGKKTNINFNYKMQLVEMKINSKNIELQKKAINIFLNNSLILKMEKRRKEKEKEEEKIKKKLNKKIKEVITINSEKLITKNKEFLKKISDPDFIYLLKLYKSKPELFSNMYQFISNTTNVQNINLKNIDLNDFKLYDDVYSKLKIILSNFKLTIPEDTCKKLLKFFGGNYDRTFRYLLSESYLQ